ncbi:MAG: hypothetical protein AB4426_25770, partial [Xenococcaceae cyanobacterium]
MPPPVQTSQGRPLYEPVSRLLIPLPTSALPQLSARR